MEPVGVRVCRETKQVSYKIPHWFNLSAVLGNSLVCISEGTAEPEGGHGGWDCKQGLVPPSQVCVLFLCCYFKAEGCRAVAQLSTRCPSQLKALLPKNHRGTGLGAGFGALTPCGNAAGLSVG